MAQHSNMEKYCQLGYFLLQRLTGTKSTLDAAQISKVNKTSWYGSDQTKKIGHLLLVIDIARPWLSVLAKWPFLPKLALNAKGLQTP